MSSFKSSMPPPKTTRLALFSSTTNKMMTKNNNINENKENEDRLVKEELSEAMKELSLKKTQNTKRITPTRLRQPPLKLSPSSNNLNSKKLDGSMAEEEESRTRSNPSTPTLTNKNKTKLRPQWDDSFSAINRKDYSKPKTPLNSASKKPLGIRQSSSVPSQHQGQQTNFINYNPLNKMNKNMKSKTPNILNKAKSAFNTPRMLGIITSTGSPVTPHPRFMKDLNNVNPLRGHNKSGTSFQDKLNKSKEEDAKLNVDVNMLRRELDVKKLECNDLLKTVDQQKATIARLELELEHKNEKIETFEIDASDYKETIQQMKSELTKLQTEVIEYQGQNDSFIL